MTIGERIKKLRIEHGMSQTELAEKMGYKNRSSIVKIEVDKIDIPLSKIGMFADLFAVSPMYILYGDEDVFPMSSVKQEFIDLIPQLSDDQVRALLTLAKQIVGRD